MEVPRQFDGVFTWLDWSVVVAYLVLTTLIGARMAAGGRATIRDFFLGGRRLVWWAVCGSIIATEVSAATFVAIPVLSFADGGNYAYLQLAVGSIIARLLIACYFVPRFYEREIYSPYDYMGQRLGDGVKKVTTALFFVGAILGQGARVFITAFVLSTIARIDLVTAIWAIGLFSVAWTLLGGITTVIWTDFIQFFVLLCGALVALGTAVATVPGGVDQVIYAASSAEKFGVLDARRDFSIPYTIWCGLIAAPFLNLAAFGTDQVMAQRMFCCRNARDAQKAIVWSAVSVFMAITMLTVGVALYAHFLHHPFSTAEQALYDRDKTYLLPMFIVRGIPQGLRGLIVAAVFASAVSTLDSTLAALSQTTLSAFLRRGEVRRGRRPRSWRDRLPADIALSKILVVIWGVVLCAFAVLCIRIKDQYANTIDLALGLVGYTYGPLLGAFLLAFVPGKRSHVGLAWSVPLAMLTVFGVSQHDWTVVAPVLGALDVTDLIVWLAAALYLVLGFVRLNADVPKLAALTAGVIAMLLLHRLTLGADESGDAKYLAYPWVYPIGTLVTFGVGMALGAPTARPSKDTRRKT
jgi:SSS family transporter